MYYKIVAHDTPDSFSSYFSLHEWQVKYQLHVPAKPNFDKSKLLVFDSLQFAEAWLKRLHLYSPWGLYECEVENPVPTDCVCRFCANHSVKYFWDNYPRLNHSTAKFDFERELLWVPPKGTCFADSVTLTRCVDDHLTFDPDGITIGEDQ